MHDPMTVAFELKYPWRVYRNPRSDFEKEYREAWCTIWHVDPETDGSDDSCGRFMRHRHGDKEIFEKIIKEFDFNWDSMFTSESTNCVYPMGWFYPNGDPQLSVYGITLNLFFSAARIMMGRDKAIKYINKHLVEILLFAENTIDSLYNAITRKFEKGCKESYKRDETIKSFAQIIYAYILRDIRPWYKHPRWHIWHWKIQIHPLQKLRRLLFDRCYYCGKRFGYHESPMSNWDGDKVWHSKCDNSKCDKRIK